MKILIAAYSCNPYRGREQGRGWNYPINLARLGHHVWVLTKIDNKQDIESELATVFPERLNLNFIYIDPYILLRKIDESPFHLIRKRTWQVRYLLWQQQAYKVAKNLDSEFDFDVVHHLTMGVITGGSKLWRLNKPFIMGPLGGGQVAPPKFKEYFGNLWKSEATRSFFLNHVVRFNPALRQVMRNTDLVISSNKDTEKLAKQLGAKRTEVFLDTGLPSSFFSKDSSLDLNICSKETVLRILWVAVLEPRKGLSLLFEALSKIKSSVPFKLTILGDGSQRKLLPTLIEKYDLGDKVRCHGYVAWDEVFEAYKAHDVLVFPSLRDSFGAQLLEAMSQGLPLITLNHHGAGDFVPYDSGVKVSVDKPAITVQELADAIKLIYEKPEVRIAMGRRSYEFAIEQSWEKKTSTILEYYKDAISRAYCEKA